MAIVDDDFQGYSIGDSVPFGDWILEGSPITNVIIAGRAPTGMSQSLRLDGDVLIDPMIPGYLASFTVFVAVFKAQSGRILLYSNGPNLTGHTFGILAVRVEQDSTISVTGPQSEILGNSHDAWFDYNAVNFLQVNVALSDVLVSGVKMINIECDVVLNGLQVISFNTTTGTPVTQLANGTSEVNRFYLTAAEAFYSAFTLDSKKSDNDYPHPGTPSVLAFQAVAEADILPDSAKLRVLQAVVEVDLLVPNRWTVTES